VPSEFVERFCTTATVETTGTTLQGGPVHPTGLKISTNYVYIMQFDGDRIAHMTTAWNAGLALKDLGWA
jgi:hypothetical protein